MTKVKVVMNLMLLHLEKTFPGLGECSGPTSSGALFPRDFGLDCVL